MMQMLLVGSLERMLRTGLQAQQLNLDLFMLKIFLVFCQRIIAVSNRCIEMRGRVQVILLAPINMAADSKAGQRWIVDSWFENTLERPESFFNRRIKTAEGWRLAGNAAAMATHSPAAVFSAVSERRSFSAVL